MKFSEIEKIINTNFIDSGLTVDQLRLVRLTCEEIEREVRTENINKMYELIGGMNISPRKQESSNV